MCFSCGCAGSDSFFADARENHLQKTINQLTEENMQLKLALNGTLSMMDELNYRRVVEGKDEHKILVLLGKVK